MVDKKVQKRLSRYSLENYKLKYEDSPKKLKLTPTAGKKDPLIVRGFRKGRDAVINFFYDLFIAIRAIIKEIM